MLGSWKVILQGDFSGIPFTAFWRHRCAPVQVVVLGPQLMCTMWCTWPLSCLVPLQPHGFLEGIDVFVLLNGDKELLSCPA